MSTESASGSFMRQIVREIEKTDGIAPLAQGSFALVR
jgi:hypothetical protein